MWRLFYPFMTILIPLARLFYKLFGIYTRRKIIIEKKEMTEIEKLEVGLEYCFDDSEVVLRKEKPS